ncbi:hypothetical protein FA95DRAFT_1609337 [Auriscalpium vulgare]|uniref:Uncharacterized protein n=1 Tax=Auriscalpium vulgare TaxID=40419 RepID=A0ACB8RIU4_9AGAM|nr:hypothetical protein FA95DRAFT_1609337 [Auriscalpium vulgare]
MYGASPSLGGHCGDRVKVPEERIAGTPADYPSSASSFGEPLQPSLGHQWHALGAIAFPDFDYTSIVPSNGVDLGLSEWFPWADNPAGQNFANTMLNGGAGYASVVPTVSSEQPLYPNQEAALPRALEPLATIGPPPSFDRDIYPIPADLSAWQCPHCPWVQRNQRAFDLRRHVRTHEAPRWACAACGRAFARRDGLARHERPAGGLVRGAGVGAVGGSGGRKAWASMGQERMTGDGAPRVVLSSVANIFWNVKSQ